MPIFIVFAEIPGNPPVIDHVNAVDIATAQTAVTAAIQKRYKGLGLNGGTLNVALIQAGAVFQVTPDPA